MTGTQSTSGRYIWTFPGAPIRISIRLEVIRRLQGILAPAEDLEGGETVARRGILMGRIDDPNGPEITAVSMPLSDEPDAIALALKNLRTAGHSVPVGFYRTQAEGPLRLSDEDFAVAREHFSDPANVFLVIRLSQASDHKATFFFWDDDSIHRDFAFLEFPFDASLLVSRESQTSGPTGLEALETLDCQPQLAVDPIRPQEPLASHRRWRPAVLAGVVAIFLLAVSAAVGVGFLKVRPPAAAKTIANPAAAVEAPLGLKFQHQGTDLLVTWDRDAAVRSRAEAGLLSIRDGQNEKAIGLNADQLRSANILLSPESDQVQVQLVLLLPNQATVSESGIAVLFSRAPSNGSVQSATAARGPVPQRTTLPVRSDEAVEQASIPVPLKNFVPQASQTPVERPTVDLPPVLDPTGVHPAAASVFSFLRQIPTTVTIDRPNPAAGAAPPSQPAASPAPAAMVGGETAKAGTQVTPAVLVSGKNPPYPFGASRAGVQGTVVVEVLVGPDGNVKQATVVSGHAMLRDAALTAVRAWIFKPASINGKPVDAPARVEVTFRGRS